MSPAKAERVVKLAEALADAYAKYLEAADLHRELTSRKEYEEAERTWADARASLIRECESPDTEAA